MKVVITVDVEPCTLLPNHDEPSYSTLKLLSFFEERKIFATFFVEGRVLESHGNVIDLMLKKGYEVGLHGYNHDNWLGGSNRKVKDARKAIQIFEKVVGEKPMGFRAPYMSFDKNVIKLLCKEGIVYDSSTCESSPPYYLCEVLEIPLSTLPLIRTPMSLGYISLLGEKVFEFLMRVYRQELLVMSFHSWITDKVYWISTLPPQLASFAKTRPSPLKVLKDYVRYLRERFNPEFVRMQEVAESGNYF